jgi:hypothetical protein
MRSCRRDDSVAHLWLRRETEQEPWRQDDVFLEQLGVERDEQRHRGHNPRRDEAGHRRRLNAAELRPRCAWHQLPTYLYGLSTVPGTMPERQMSAFRLSGAGMRSRSGTIGCWPARAAMRTRRRSISAVASLWLHSHGRTGEAPLNEDEKLRVRSNCSAAAATNQFVG